MPAVAAIVPAKDEAERVAATVAALRGLPEVDLVVVVDDGSTDETHLAAAGAGALVVRHHANQGKAAALTTGVARVREVDVVDGTDADGTDVDGTEGEGARRFLFADADLGASAANLGPLLAPVLAGEADLAVANIPRAASSGGGGRVVRLAQRQIEAMTGRRIAQPLNGMRCLSGAAVDAATPLARGWGVEAVMLVDVLRAGLTVVEVPVELTHRQTGTDLRGRLHRARQLRDVALALARRRLR